MGYGSRRAHWVPFLSTNNKKTKKTICTRSLKLDKKRSGKGCLVWWILISAGCNIWIVGSEFGVNNMKAWIHPAWYQWFRLVLVGYFSSWHTLAPLVLVKGCLNSTAWVMLLTMSVLLWLQCKYLVMATSSRIMCHLTKLKSSQPDFLNKTMCSLDSNGLHSNQISIKLSTFGMWWNGRFTSWMCSWQICSNNMMISCQYEPKSLRNVSNTLLNVRHAVKN